MACVYKRSSGQWEAKVRRQGYSQQSKSFNSKTRAEEWARSIENEMDDGYFVCRKQAETTTLNEALDRYYREVSPRKKGYANEKYKINGWKRHPLAHRFLASIRGVDLAKYRDARLALGRAHSTVRQELALISHLYNIARKEWGMESLRNPVQNITLPSQANQRDRRLRGNEEERLLEACRQSRSTGLESIMRLAIETGMRLGEMLKLEWRYVDFERRVAHLPDTKNGTSRDVPLSTRAVKVLEERPRSSDDPRVYFEWKRADCFEKGWRKVMKRAEIEDFRFHDLRHEATSRFFELGLKIMEVSAITGHKSLQMLKRYTHLRAEDLARKLG